MAIHIRKEIPSERQIPSSLTVTVHRISTWKLEHRLGSDTNGSDHTHSHPGIASPMRLITCHPTNEFQYLASTSQQTIERTNDRL